MYAQVTLTAVRAPSSILVPANALVIRSEGPQVATVRDGKVHYVTLRLGRDLGTELEVIAGLSEGEQVVLNPSDAVEEGAEVRVMVSEPADKPGAAPAAKSR